MSYELSAIELPNGLDQEGSVLLLKQGAQLMQDVTSVPDEVTRLRTHYAKKGPQTLTGRVWGEHLRVDCEIMFGLAQGIPPAPPKPEDYWDPNKYASCALIQTKPSETTAWVKGFGAMPVSSAGPDTEADKWYDWRVSVSTGNVMLAIDEVCLGNFAIDLSAQPLSLIMAVKSNGAGANGGIRWDQAIKWDW